MDSGATSTGKRNDHQGVAEEIEGFQGNDIDDHDIDNDEVELPKFIVDDRKELEAKFVRKLDMRLLPLMMLICMTFHSIGIRIACIVVANKPWKMF